MDLDVRCSKKGRKTKSLTHSKPLKKYEYSCCAFIKFYSVMMTRCWLYGFILFCHNDYSASGKCNVSATDTGADITFPLVPLFTPILTWQFNISIIKFGGIIKGLYNH